MATLPGQAAGPGPTDQALPSYLSYSPAATRTIVYTSSLTQIVYDPQGSFAPYQTVNVVQGTSTAIDYSIVNVPLLYTGPFPAPPLGSLYTTPGQSVSSSAVPTATAETSAVPSTVSVSNSAPTPTSTSISVSVSDTSANPASTTDSASGSSTGTATATASESTNASSTATGTAPVSSSETSGSATTATATGSESGSPSATAAGGPNAGVRASNGLSGGQIAGIVLGAVFGLLLLLLLLLCCLRRRRRRQKSAADGASPAGSGSRRSRWASGFSRGASRGNYAAVGAAAAGAAGAAAAGGRRGSLDSDEWEEDHLTGGGGGSGFFVVGGKKLGHDGRGSIASRRSRRASGSPNAAGPSYATYSNTAPSRGMEGGSSMNVEPSSSSSAYKGGWAGLAAGAGVLGAALGLKKSKGKEKPPRVEIEEEPRGLSDEEMGDGDISERRGLMQFTDSPSKGYYGSPGNEMSEVGRGGPFTAHSAAAAAAAGGYLASSRSANSLGGAFNGSGASSPRAGQGSSESPGSRSVAVAMSNSGSGSGSGSGPSLPPPPRAPRGSTRTYGNIAPPSSTASPHDSDPHGSADTGDSAALTDDRLHPALLGVGVGALGGLGALAAGHRHSGQSTNGGEGRSSRPVERGSQVSELSADELGHLRSTDPERYSRFISIGSNLLGPGFHDSPEAGEAESEQFNPSPDPVMTGPGANTAFQRTRLPTIRSVGEFGETSDVGEGAAGSPSTSDTTSLGLLSMPSDSPAVSAGRRSGLGFHSFPNPRLQPGGTLPEYATLHVAPPQEAGSDFIPSPATPAAAAFVTPPDSPRDTLGRPRSVRSAHSTQRPSTDVGRLHNPFSDDDDEETGAAHLTGSERGHRLGNDDNMSAANENGELAEGLGVTAAGTGILGGMAAGWRRLTMGQYAWIPGSATRAYGTSERDPSGEDIETGSDSLQPLDYQSEARAYQPGQQLREGRGARAEASDPGLMPGVRSERASVHVPSAQGHSPAGHRGSKEVSGSSNSNSSGRRNKRNDPSASSAGGVSGTAVAGALGALAASRRDEPSFSSSRSSERSRGGYSASLSNTSSSGRRIGSDGVSLDHSSGSGRGSSRSTGTGSGSSRSGNRTGRRRGSLARSAFSSDGGASYGPGASLGRSGSNASGGIRALGIGEALTTPDDSAAYYGPGHSSGDADNQTSGGDGLSGLDRRRRARSSSFDEFGRLSSLREVRESPDAFGEGFSSPDLSSLPHSPSPGAAQSRLSASSALRTLQPGLAAPAPAALAASMSTPSLGSADGENAEVRTVQGRAIPASASWRPSPRVASAAQRAAEAQARLEERQQQLQQRQASPGHRRQLSMPGGPTPPRSQTASPAGAAGAGRGASFNWADLDTTFRRAEPRNTTGADHTQMDPEAADDQEPDPDRSNKSFDWPKFLRF
ncbi:hypothetical protein BCV70DRAFT_88669 [Testicularia cyperi]|uniref:Uncharacterized protein n=1 Tax=Testicularia cyperi TaxID=1882483 RepID=A0A317XTB9_9BASI|nr:hypothetical protein BCV70DRAFT_88669 [Testicularia cyperi]